jgi:LPS O-antigen subunit length determinant protein (WzzB/FepE family)
MGKFTVNNLKSLANTISGVVDQVEQKDVSTAFANSLTEKALQLNEEKDEKEESPAEEKAEDKAEMLMKRLAAKALKRAKKKAATKRKKPKPPQSINRSSAILLPSQRSKHLMMPQSHLVIM